MGERQPAKQTYQIVPITKADVSKKLSKRAPDTGRVYVATGHEYVRLNATTKAVTGLEGDDRVGFGEMEDPRGTGTAILMRRDPSSEIIVRENQEGAVFFGGRRLGASLDLEDDTRYIVCEALRKGGKARREKGGGETEERVYVLVKEPPPRREDTGWSIRETEKGKRLAAEVEIGSDNFQDVADRSDLRDGQRHLYVGMGCRNARFTKRLTQEIKRRVGEIDGAAFCDDLYAGIVKPPDGSDPNRIWVVIGDKQEGRRRLKEKSGGLHFRSSDMVRNVDIFEEARYELEDIVWYQPGEKKESRRWKEIGKVLTGNTEGRVRPVVLVMEVQIPVSALFDERRSEEVVNG